MGLKIERTKSGLIIDGDWESIAGNDFCLQAVRERPDYYRPYREVLERYWGGIAVGEPIADDIEVSIISYANLHPDKFRLRDKDRKTWGRIRHPGKSGHIAHTDDVRVAVVTMLGRYCERGDRLFTFPAGLVREAGLMVVYAPMGRRILHGRIAPGECGLDSTGDLPQGAREKLVEAVQPYMMPSPGQMRRAALGR